MPGAHPPRAVLLLPLALGLGACDLLTPSPPPADVSRVPEEIRTVGDSVAALRASPFRMVPPVRAELEARLGLDLRPGIDSTVIPGEYRERVISRDPETLEYRLDPSAVGIPGGVRVLLYQRDTSGSLVLPLAERGRIDFTDEDRPDYPPRMGIRLELDGTEAFDVIEAAPPVTGEGAGWDGTRGPDRQPFTFAGSLSTYQDDEWGSYLYLSMFGGDKELAMIQLHRSEWPGAPPGSLDFRWNSIAPGPAWMTVESLTMEAEAGTGVTRLQGYLSIRVVEGQRHPAARHSEARISVSGSLLEPEFAFVEGDPFPDGTLSALAATWGEVLETADTLGSWLGVDLRLY